MKHINLIKEALRRHNSVIASKDAAESAFMVFTGAAAGWKVTGRVASLGKWRLQKDDWILVCVPSSKEGYMLITARKAKTQESEYPHIERLKSQCPSAIPHAAKMGLFWTEQVIQGWFGGEVEQDPEAKQARLIRQQAWADECDRAQRPAIGQMGVQDIMECYVEAVKKA